MSKKTHEKISFNLDIPLVEQMDTDKKKRFQKRTEWLRDAIIAKLNKVDVGVTTHETGK